MGHKRHAFRPDAIGSLEPRVVPSGVPAHVGDPPAGYQSPVGHQGAQHPRDTEQARFEVRWMRGMLAHHTQAIRMARMSLENSEDPEVRDLAQGIIRAQTKENRNLRSWLSGWYGVRNPRPLPGDDMGMPEGMAMLRGAEFDRMFLTEMTGHHRAAIEDARELLANVWHKPLKRLGNAIITTQTAEIGRMQAMLGGSGGDDHAGHHG